MRKSISIQTLYHSVNGNAPEMDSKVFAKIIRHMDKEITDHELDFLFKAFDADGSGQISYPEFAKVEIFFILNFFK
jgi:Ca2+-binding EF-hand superfamily protein